MKFDQLTSEIFVNSVKPNICHSKDLRLWHNLPTSVNDRVISQRFNIFRKLHPQSFTKNKTLMKFSVYRPVPKMTWVICPAVLMPVRSFIPFAVDPTIKQNVRPELYF